MVSEFSGLGAPPIFSWPIFLPHGNGARLTDHVLLWLSCCRWLLLINPFARHYYSTRPLWSERHVDTLPSAHMPSWLHDYIPSTLTLVKCSRYLQPQLCSPESQFPLCSALSSTSNCTGNSACSRIVIHIFLVLRILGQGGQAWYVYHRLHAPRSYRPTRKDKGFRLDAQALPHHTLIACRLHETSHLHRSFIRELSAIPPCGISGVISTLASTSLVLSCNSHRLVRPCSTRHNSSSLCRLHDASRFSHRRGRARARDAGRRRVVSSPNKRKQAVFGVERVVPRTTDAGHPPGSNYQAYASTSARSTPQGLDPLFWNIPSPESDSHAFAQLAGTKYNRPMRVHLPGGHAVYDPVPRPRVTRFVFRSY